MKLDKTIKDCRLVSGFLCLISGPFFLYIAILYAFVFYLIAAIIFSNPESFGPEDMALMWLYLVYALLMFGEAVVLGVFGAFLMQNYYTGKRRWAQDVLGFLYMAIFAFATYFMIGKEYVDGSRAEWAEAITLTIGAVCFLIGAFRFINIPGRVKMLFSSIGSLMGVTNCIIQMANSDKWDVTEGSSGLNYTWIYYMAFALMLCIFLIFLASNTLKTIAAFRKKLTANL